MKTIAYMLRLSAIRLVRNYRASFILLLSFYAGLILPAFCFANAKYYKIQTDKQNFAEYQNTAHLSFMSGVYGQQEFEQLIKAAGTDTAQLSVRNWDVVAEFENGNATLLGLGGQYQSFEGIQVVQGRSFTKEELEEGSSVCMVNQTALDEYGYRVGKAITIQGEQLEIIGSMNDSRYTGYILLPAERMKQIYPQSELQHTVDFKTDHIEDSLLDAQNYLRKRNPDIDIILSQGYEENAAEMKSLVKDMIIARGIWGLCAYAFSAVNIAMFVFQRMYESRKRYAIQEVHGMKPGQLFGEILAENMLLVLIANIFLTVTIKPLGKLFGLANEMAADLYLFFPLFGLSAGFCVFLSIMMIYRYKKVSVNDILIQEG